MTFYQKKSLQTCCMNFCKKEGDKN